MPPRSGRGEGLVVGRAGLRTRQTLSATKRSSAVGWMPSCLVQAGNSSYALEEKGNEGSLIFCGQLQKRVAEGCGVRGAHIGWDLHACEDDFCGGVFCFYGIDDGLEVGGCFGYGYAS